jgi:hypothetical protein
MRVQVTTGHERDETRPLDDQLLTASLALAQTQMLAQLADETSLDGRTMGVLAFNGALLAADVAAKDILGRWWWVPIVALGLATLICLRSVLNKESDLGPLASTFYETYGAYEGERSVEARKQLLSDLGAAFEENAQRVKTKTRTLRQALAILGVGLVVATLLITLDSPTRLSTHEQHRTTPRSAASRSGADASPLVGSARWAEWPTGLVG